MKLGEVTKEMIKRFAVESTKSSAEIEDRNIPANFVRSPKVVRFLVERQSQS